MKNLTFSTQDVLEIAFAAQRTNGSYVKYTQRYSEPCNKTVFANKELVRYKLDNRFAPGDFESFEVTEIDCDNAIFAKEHFKKYTLKLLADDLTGFQKEILDSLSTDIVNSKSIGLLSYVPEMIKRDLEEAKFKKLLRTQYRNSEYVGAVGDKIQGAIKILQAFYSSNWERWAYTADYNGNLVSFMSADMYPVNSNQRIRARVKDQVKNRCFSVDESRLNYVKVYRS